MGDGENTQPEHREQGDAPNRDDEPRQPAKGTEQLPDPDREGPTPDERNPQPEPERAYPERAAGEDRPRDEAD